MSASDHLSRQQFMPIEEVGALPSQFGTPTVEESYQNHDLRYGPIEQSYARHKGYDSAEEYQAALRDHIAEHGMVNPVITSPGGMGNGHHRYYAARDLGWSQIPAERWGPQSKLKDVPGWGR